ncbi:hypothetical protein BS78_07G185400 [Paspalum vaginatum]|nr:hypothetical protein BS78_07G185400 [Paspalum vaginatum]
MEQPSLTEMPAHLLVWRQGVAGRCCLPLSPTAACGRLQCSGGRAGGWRSVGLNSIACPCPCPGLAGCRCLCLSLFFLPFKGWRRDATLTVDTTHARNCKTARPPADPSLTFRSSSRAPP